MPSKIQLDENLWFLYLCLKSSDYKVIDFNAVGTAANLKAPAARMRYTRLRRAIEGGTLIGTHGMPFQAEHEKKRKKLEPSSDEEDPGKSSERRRVDHEDHTGNRAEPMPRARPRRVHPRLIFNMGDEMDLATDGEDETDEEYEETEKSRPRKRRRTRHIGKKPTGARTWIWGIHRE